MESFCWKTALPSENMLQYRKQRMIRTTPKRQDCSFHNPSRVTWRAIPLLPTCSLKRGFRAVYRQGSYEQQHFLVLDPLGEALTDKLENHPPVFSRKSVFTLAIRLLACVENLHSLGLVVDSRPSNYSTWEQLRWRWKMQWASANPPDRICPYRPIPTRLGYHFS